MHSHNRQHLFKQLAQDWKSYFNSIKDYKKNPNKYKGQPKPPNFKYLDHNPGEIIFTNLATRISKNFKDTSQIKQLRIKRKNYILNYLHQASRKIINLAKYHQVSKIVIGDIKQIKQKMNYNKSFVQIPIQRLKELIEYKAKLEGIELITVNEAYTSGCTKTFDLKYAM